MALSLAAVPVWADESTEFRYSFLPIDVTVSSFSDGYSNINSCSIVKNIDFVSYFNRYYYRYSTRTGFCFDVPVNGFYKIIVPIQIVARSEKDGSVLDLTPKVQSVNSKITGIYENGVFTSNEFFLNAHESQSSSHSGYCFDLMIDASFNREYYVIQTQIGPIQFFLTDNPLNAGITPPTAFKCANCGRSVTYDEAQRLSWKASFSDAECEKWPDLANMNGKYYWVCLESNGGCGYTDNRFTYGCSVGNQATYEPGKTTVVQPDGTTINNIITVNPSTGTPVVNVTVIEPSPCSHIYDTGTREEPTCTTPGKLTQFCTKCGDTKITVLDPIPHKYDEGTTLEPTCVTSGKLTQTCTVCGDIKVTVLPALGHDWAVKKTVTTQYDDTGAVVQQGYVLYECTRCQEQYKSETIDGETKPPPGGGGSSGGGSGGSGEGGGSDEGGGGSGGGFWDKLGDFLGTVLGGALDVIGAALGKVLDILTQVVENLVEGIKSLVTGLLDSFTVILDFGGGFKDFLASFFTWLPPEISALLVLSISLGIFLMIIKFFRG